MTLFSTGEQVGPFIIGEELNSGVMAHIYQAEFSAPSEDWPYQTAVKGTQRGYDDFLCDKEEGLRDLHHMHIIRSIRRPTQTGEIWPKRYICRTTTGEPPLWHMALEDLEGSSLP